MTNGSVNLADAILGLQVLAGISSGDIHLAADLDNNKHIDMAEVIYILQKENNE